MKKKDVKNRFGNFEDDGESLGLEDFEGFSFNHSMSGLSKPVKFKDKYSKGEAEGNHGKFKSEKKKKKRLHKDDFFF